MMLVLCGVDEIEGFDKHVLLQRCHGAQIAGRDGSQQMRKACEQLYCGWVDDVSWKR